MRSARSTAVPDEAPQTPPLEDPGTLKLARLPRVDLVPERCNMRCVPPPLCVQLCTSIVGWRVTIDTAHRTHRRMETLFDSEAGIVRCVACGSVLLSEDQPDEEPTAKPVAKPATKRKRSSGRAPGYIIKSVTPSMVARFSSTRHACRIAMVAAGVPGIGLSRAAKVVSAFPSFSALRDASVDQLRQVVVKENGACLEEELAVAIWHVLR